jgi:tetratricopeptide (TPR) repeat protein
MSGMYQMAVGVSGVSGTVRDMIQAHDLATGQRALQEGRFEKALGIFHDAIPDYREKAESVKQAQRLGMARAYMGLEKWQDALDIFEAVMTEHDEAACLAPCACQSLARKLRARADILERLDRRTEAETDRERAGHLACPRDGVVRFLAERFEQETFDRLATLIAREDWEQAFAYIDDIIVKGKDGRQPERSALAGLLCEHAEILAQVGEREKAQDDRAWADALTRDIEAADETRDERDTEERYVDFVE